MGLGRNGVGMLGTEMDWGLRLLLYGDLFVRKRVFLRWARSGPIASEWPLEGRSARCLAPFLGVALCVSLFV